MKIGKKRKLINKYHTGKQEKEEHWKILPKVRIWWWKIYNRWRWRNKFSFCLFRFFWTPFHRLFYGDFFFEEDSTYTLFFLSRNKFESSQSFSIYSLKKTISQFNLGNRKKKNFDNESYYRKIGKRRKLKNNYPIGK